MYWTWPAAAGGTCNGWPRMATVCWASTVRPKPWQWRWPLAGQHFDAVVVTNYLWRPLWPQILESLTPGGVLICETFAQGNETVGRPSRRDFLLAPGELLEVASRGGLRVVAYEDGFLDAPARFVQRMAAVREAPAQDPVRWPLV